MSWLSQHTGIHWNLRPYASTIGGIAGGLIGGPLGAGLGAGLFKTGDNLAHGDSVGHALGQGVLNGAIAYGTAGMFGGGNPDPTSTDALRSLPVRVTPDASNPALAAAANSGNAVRDNVVKRVVGSAGSFIKNNKDTLELAGNAASGAMAAQAQNAQASAEQTRANAEAAQIQQALDKQKAIAAAFSQMYARPLPAAGAPALPGSPVRDQVMSRVVGMAPQGSASSVMAPPKNGDDNDPRIGDPGVPNVGPSVPQLPKVPNPLGIAIPSSPYAGNESMYGSPYGYGYANVGRYFGGY